MKIPPINGLLFSSATVGGMNANDNFLVQGRTNLDIEEECRLTETQSFPPQTHSRKSSPHSPFLNVVERAISCLKAAIEADISLKDAWITEIRPEPEESH